MTHFQRTALCWPLPPAPWPCRPARTCRPTVRFDRQVNYGDAKGVELVTNEFGSTDLQMIAEKMTGSLLETGIFQGRPTVTISTVKNKTSEYIDTTNVMNSIQTALVKSGKVRFTRSINEMQARRGRAAAPEPERPVQAEHHRQGRPDDGGQVQLEGELTSIVKQTTAPRMCSTSSR
jgi:hypothetical protein